MLFLQVQATSSGPKLYNGPIDVVKVLYKQGGIRSIYKGTCATLLRGMSVIFPLELCVCWTDRSIILYLMCMWTHATRDQK